MGCLRASTWRAWRLARRPSHNIACVKCGKGIPNQVIHIRLACGLHFRAASTYAPDRVDLPLPRAPYGTDGYSSENLFNGLNTKPSGTPRLYLIKCIHVNKQSDIQDLNDTNTCPLMAT